MSDRVLDRPTPSTARRVRRPGRLRILVTSVALGLVASALGPAVASADTAEGQDDWQGWQRPVKPGWKDDKAAHGWIMSKLRHMTLEEKVGQLFVTHVYGDSVNTTNPADVSRNQNAYGVNNAKEFIEKYHPGGVIYYTWSNNVNNPRQIAELSNGIQDVALDQRMPIPMLIATDQEQGLVVRVREPATMFPGNMALGAGGRPQDAFQAARITGQELRALGINQNYAPVADVNVNPANPVIGVRSVGSDPDLVSSITGAQVLGYQGPGGVIATAKHFPGHGDTDKDSHTTLPRINHTREEWEQIDAPPFKTAIDAGIDSIMTAHIVFPELEPEGVPATISKPIMTGILREDLGFDGVIVTDALGMSGVGGDLYGHDRIPVLALKAGVDILLKSPEGLFDLQYNAVLDAVRGGEISESRIDESVYRILRMKYRRGLFHRPFVDVGRIDRVVGTDRHLRTAERITDRTTTLVKNDGGLLPLAEGDRDVLVTGWGVNTTRTLGSEIAERGATTDVYETGVIPNQAEIDAAAGRAAESDLAVVTTCFACTSNPAGAAQQTALVEALIATGTPVVAVGVRNPYDINAYTGADAYLATYSYREIALESAVKVLFGEVSPAGKLPVMIPVAGDPETPLYEFGHGLTY